MDMTIVIFAGFVIVLVVYYFLKAGFGFDVDSLRSVKVPQTPLPGLGERKRIHPRADVNWSVSIETPEGTIEAELRNISLGGAFICCKKPMPVGEVLSLTITVPDNEPITATAVVAWSNVNLPDDRVINRGMGVRFIKMSDRHIQLVREVFQKND